MLKIVRRLLKLANVLNWLFCVLFMLILIISFIAPELFVGQFLKHLNDKSLINVLHFWLSIVFILPIFITPAAHIIFTKLIDMIDDFRGGSGFSLRNSNRLKHIGMALLFINIIDLFYGWVSVTVSLETGEYFGWSLSATGWFAVILLFVLAKMFKEGAIMREDLEGTV